MVCEPSYVALLSCLCSRLMSVDVGRECLDLGQVELMVFVACRSLDQTGNVWTVVSRRNLDD